MSFLTDILDAVPVISVITQIEALSWINIDKSKEKILCEFIDDAHILSITPDVVKRCVDIKRNRKIKTPDAIIAATAISNNLILITSDQDFQNINGLQIIDPTKL